ncbi:hypothetical protein L226DRAFT_614631 [Lentinus tigrinus ALCF2SS1-7]|uniref:Extracellular metalloproteinase n=1 Tax=Lentinus tigrinus ALCF2SS1-6 TaxID=1328759 RepID=A0A5C2S6D9_9APHY|nr:hypothetical protein L227DRAFT_612711 [Lentinus tigrinus ALCF2SS1-6]RPD72757.1 hypothetical protein L226DRAFT_614631 [Lentinus tigrinus ALCF2SS1-7]
MRTILTLLFVAVLRPKTVTAVPFPATSKYATHHTHEIRRGVEIKSYHPPSVYETYDGGIDHPLSKRAEASVEDSAVAFIQLRHGIVVSDLQLVSSFYSDTASHVYFRQKANRIPFANAVANVAFNKGRIVVVFGSSFVNVSRVASPTPPLPVEDAIAIAEKQLDGTDKIYNPDHFPVPQLEYLMQDDGFVALTHSFQVRNAAAGTWFQAFVDAASGELVSIIDYVAHASYLALPVWKETLSEGLEMLVDPQDHALSYKGDTTSVTTASSSEFVFDYPLDLDEDPTTQANVDAARVNTFYLVNTVHDIMYKYGFTETAFNFQWSNFGKGGKGGDRVQISVQSNLGIDNAAAFTTLPEGMPGFMTMMLWDYTNPERDGALENDIVTHENMHGLTNRMTGGGTASCLRTTESRGMGEGWSDAFTDAFVPDFIMGQYVTNATAGSRTYPYSTSATTNPFRYSSIQTLNEVHGIGEVWANMLPRRPRHGQRLIQHWPHRSQRRLPPPLHRRPSSPTMTFVNARDAWVQADVNRYGGANKCTLWKAFANRGLGVNAANYVDDDGVPDDC